MDVKNWYLSKNDSAVMKGIAICGMLCWHLFYCDNPLNRAFPEAVRFFGMLGDVCVSMFLFVSGYGMAFTLCKSESGGGKYEKVIERLIKFYFSFWPVFVIMVPIGIFVFDRPLEFDSTSQKIMLLESLYHFFALSGHSSYNATWWYNSLIIPLYLLSPILFYCVKKMPIASIIFSFFFVSFRLRIGVDLGIYTPIFLLGMVWYLNNCYISEYLNRFGRKSLTLVCLVLLILLSLSLLLIPAPIFSKGIVIYNLMTIVLAIITIEYSDKLYIISKPLSFLGKHSANIFFVHTLIFYYWFPNFFYSIQSPIVIFLVLLVISIIVSYFFDVLKSLCRLTSLQGLLINKLQNKYFLNYK